MYVQIRPILCLLVLSFTATVLGGCASRPAPARQEAPTAPTPVQAAPGVDPALADAVRRLASPDFVERTRAAETLVSRGPAALPALGAAGDQPVAAPGDTSVSSTRPVVEAILSAAEAESVENELDSAWPTVRRAAAEELGRRGRWSPIPQLIARLGDPDLEVRGASVESLRRLTNNFFGYRASAAGASRTGAATRWQTWWHQVGRAKADASGSPSFAAR